MTCWGSWDFVSHSCVLILCAVVWWLPLFHMKSEEKILGFYLVKYGICSFFSWFLMNTALLGVFAKLWKVTITVFMCVCVCVCGVCMYEWVCVCVGVCVVCLCLSVCCRSSFCPSARNNLAPTGQNSKKFDIWIFFENLSRVFEFH